MDVCQATDFGDDHDADAGILNGICTIEDRANFTDDGSCRQIFMKVSGCLSLTENIRFLC